MYFAESLETFAADLQRARPTVFFSRAATVGQVPAGRAREDAGAEARPAARDSDRARCRSARKCWARSGSTSARSPRAAPRRCRPTCCAGTRGSASTSSRCYGMTENCGVSHSTLQGKPRPGTVGYPYDGVLSRIDPETDEIQVTSPGTMLGYYKEPEQTRRRLHARTAGCAPATRASSTPRAGCASRGRVKDLFKTSKGKYVAPAPIEDKLVMHTAVEACCVTGANLGQPLGIVMLNLDAVQRAAVAVGTRGARGLARGPPRVDQRAARSARAARLPGGRDAAVDRRERAHHADLQGAAQPGRGRVRAVLRPLAGGAPLGHLARGVKRAAARAQAPVS